MGGTKGPALPEAAEELDITPQAVQKRISSGSLLATQVGRSWVIPAGAVRKLSDPA